MALSLSYPFRNGPHDLLLKVKLLMFNSLKKVKNLKSWFFGKGVAKHTFFPILCWLASTNKVLKILKDLLWIVFWTPSFDTWWQIEFPRQAPGWILKCTQASAQNNFYFLFKCAWDLKSFVHWLQDVNYNVISVIFTFPKNVYVYDSRTCIFIASCI